LAYNIIGWPYTSLDLRLSRFWYLYPAVVSRWIFGTWNCLVFRRGRPRINDKKNEKIKIVRQLKLRSASWYCWVTIKPDGRPTDDCGRQSFSTCLPLINDIISRAIRKKVSKKNVFTCPNSEVPSSAFGRHSKKCLTKY